MENVSIKIGEHYLKVASRSSIILHFFKRNYQPFIWPSARASDLIVTIVDNYGTAFVDYEVKRIEEENRLSFQRADYLIEVDKNYKEAIVYVHDELALKHAFMNLYSSFIVYHNWGLLIHSSCVIEKGQAHIFSGHSGAGKSTAAKLSHPRELLSDEATIVKILEGEITVYNSPFRSEMEAQGNSEIAPLSSIQLLHQSLINKRVKRKKSEALLSLADKVFFWSNKPNEAKIILHLLKTLIDSVDVYDLYFQKNNTFWELISNDALYSEERLRNL